MLRRIDGGGGGGAPCAMRASLYMVMSLLFMCRL